MRPGDPPALFMLAGTSEAGKSTAGQFFADLGARRIKIREVLKRLDSGHPAHHEGVEAREGFDSDEFVDRLLDLRHCTQRVLVIESFIDVRLADATARTWPGACATIFITAPLELRTSRLSAASGCGIEQASGIIRLKDQRKQVNQQMSAWRSAADYWIENADDIDAFKRRLRDVFHAFCAPEEQEH